MSVCTVSAKLKLNKYIEAVGMDTARPRNGYDNNTLIGSTSSLTFPFFTCLTQSQSSAILNHKGQFSLTHPKLIMSQLYHMESKIFMKINILPSPTQSIQIPTLLNPSSQIFNSKNINDHLKSGKMK